MDDKALTLDASVDGFFARAGLVHQDRIDCVVFVEDRYPDEEVALAPCQGYCSLTMFVGASRVIQFRPQIFQLDLRIAQAARDVYGAFVPETEYMDSIPSSGLLVYSMDRIAGISFDDFRITNKTAAHSTQHLERLCRDFAGFLAKGWHNGSSASLPLGTVGLSLVARLKSLVVDLPRRFQGTARNVLSQLHRIEALPWVMTHGDIIAANMMVDPTACTLRGLVDWAEAERLPFGTCLYGLEEILGEMTPSGFRYRQDAAGLRDVFWTELQRNIPELGGSQVLETVKLARDLGVLLWHGIAFDNGAIDRVVQEGIDVKEIHRLDAFLETGVDFDFQHTFEREWIMPCAANITPPLAPLAADTQRNRIPAQ